MSDDSIGADVSTITPDTEKRRRAGDDDTAWLSQNEHRITDLLTTLGVVGYKKLQQTIQSKLGRTIAERPLRTFLDKHYGSGSCGSTTVHDQAMTAASSSGDGDELVSVKAIYSKLRVLFLKTPCSIEDLTHLLLKFSINMSSRTISDLLVRLQWDIEASNSFSPAIGQG